MTRRDFHQEIASLIPRSTAWQADRAIYTVHRPVISAVLESGAARGLEKSDGRMGAGRGGTISILDPEQFEARHMVFLSGDVIDVFYSSGITYRDEAWHHPRSKRDRCPTEATAAMKDGSSGR